MRKIFTIGHSQHHIDYFIKMLQTHNINYVIDVRSVPFSQYAVEYNKGIINASLATNKIKYSFMGKYFGARPKNKALYSSKGFLDFNKMKINPDFLMGISNVIKGIDQGARIALMCTEKDPIECHRAILVANTFFENGIGVDHILANNNLESHEELNNRLVDMCFPHRNQISLFEDENLTEEEYLIEAYKIQNEKIGYIDIEEKFYIS